MAVAGTDCAHYTPVPSPRVRSERALVREALRGSEEAVAELFQACWPGAYRAAFLIVHDHAAAEDIAQEALVSAIRALDRFDRRRPLRPWLHRIVVNRAIDWARLRALRGEVLEREASDGDASGDNQHGWSDPVLSALGALAPDQRAVIVLRHLLEYTPGEIAGMLDLPRGTVNSRLRRGLDVLGSQLREGTR